MLRFILLAVLTAVFLVHMKDSYINDFPRRVITKPMLIPLIAVYYLLFAPSVSWVLVAALAASWLGDIFLMPAGDKWFVIGGIFFLAAHILFILVYVPQITVSALRPGLLLLAAVPYLLCDFLVLRRVWSDTPALMRVPMSLYLLANTAMNLCALSQLMTHPGLGGALAWGGAILFFASDCMLFLCEYGGMMEKLRHYFYVMLTYVPGTFLIAQGLMLL